MPRNASNLPLRRRGQNQEILALRARLRDAEEMLRAFTSGEVDAILRPGASGQQVYTLKGADHVYRLMVETMSEGAVTLSPTGVILYANRRFADLLKADLDDVIGRKIQEFAESAEQATLTDLLQKNQSGEKRFAIALRTPAGAPVEVQIAMRRLEVDGTECTIAVVTDLSELRRAEAELRLADEQFRLAIEAAPTGLLLANPAGTIVQINAQIEHILGYSRSELIGRAFDTFVPPPAGENQSRLQADLCAAAPDDRDNARCALRKDGTEVPVEVAFTAFHTSHGELILVSVVDLSSRREVERARTEFVSMVSHELRTPLTAIVGSMGLLQSGAMGTLPLEAADMVRIAHKNCVRLQRLISDILDIGALDSGHLAMEIRSVELAEVIRQSVEASAGYAEKHDVRFLQQSTGVGGQVLADPHRLVQVLANLLSNAAKFSRPGADVLLRVSAGERTMRVEVEDSGKGIPADFQSRIFEKFAQADSTPQRRYEGAGLGLNIARKLIEAMGGQIGFSTVVDQGTIFHIEIPRADAVPAAAAGDHLKLSRRELTMGLPAS
jgi:PAS domain S-box-containing protein